MKQASMYFTLRCASARQIENTIKSSPDLQESQINAQLFQVPGGKRIWQKISKQAI